VALNSNKGCFKGIINIINIKYVTVEIKY